MPTTEDFQGAANRGDLSRLKELWEQITTPEGKSAMIAAGDYEAFRYAARRGHLLVLEKLREWASDAQKSAMIVAEGYEAFRDAAGRGHLPVLKQLWAWAPEQHSAMIEARDYRGDYPAFREAAGGGHLPVLEKLREWATLEQRSAMIKASDYLGDYAAFRYAADRGHLPVLEKLWAWASDAQKRAMIAAETYGEGYAAFRAAARRGHLPVLEKLREWATLEQRSAMITAQDYAAFREAAGEGYLLVLEKLWDWATPEQRSAMIAAGDYAAFYKVVRKNYPAVINWLLLYPSMLAHAEMHQNEYGDYVNPFIATQLSTLQVRSQAYALEHPGVAFDVSDPDEIKRGFYMARNLIRRTHPASAETPALLAELNFLLNIPAVRALAHQRVENGPENELIRLAITTGNQLAATVLLAIPEVQRLALQNNYYHTEAQGGLDLRALAQNRESAMQALSVGEQKRLAQAEAHYKPLMEREGIEKLFEDFRKQLVARYTENPASVMIKDQKTPLPVTWKDFQDLSLTEAERAEALKAYYQHTDHTVLRYLSKPNAWMAPNASYVVVNPDRREERWATFEEYKGLIVLLCLAAQDTSMPPQAGSAQDRLTHFLTELALIARAHNWDKTRTQSGRSSPEHYDDLEGDKPSCFSGVKRRLFQSVVDHPLLKMMDIPQELNEFIRAQLKAQLESMSAEEKSELLAAWNNYCISLESSEAEPLGALHIDETKQKAFLASLREKYKDQFDAVSEATVKHAFIAEDHGIQALKLSRYCDFSQLLQVSSPSHSPTDLCVNPITRGGGPTRSHRP